MARKRSFSIHVIFWEYPTFPLTCGIESILHPGIYKNIHDTIWFCPAYQGRPYQCKKWPVVIIIAHQWNFGCPISTFLLESNPVFYRHGSTTGEPNQPKKKVSSLSYANRNKHTTRINIQGLSNLAAIQSWSPQWGYHKFLAFYEKLVPTKPYGASRKHVSSTPIRRRGSP